MAQHTLLTTPAYRQDALREDLRACISANTPLGTTLSDQDWLPQNVLDSLAIVEVLAFIEERIGRSLEEHEETESTIATIEAIVAFIQRHAPA